MGGGSYRRRMKKWGCGLLMFALLIGFLFLNLASNYMIAFTRFIQEPPNVDCNLVLSRNDNMEQKAFIEYLSQSNVNFADAKADINKHVSREGYYVCFC